MCCTGFNQRWESYILKNIVACAYWRGFVSQCLLRGYKRSWGRDTHPGLGVDLTTPVQQELHHVCVAPFWSHMQRSDSILHRRKNQKEQAQCNSAGQQDFGLNGTKVAATHIVIWPTISKFLIFKSQRSTETIMHYCYRIKDGMILPKWVSVYCACTGCTLAVRQREDPVTENEAHVLLPQTPSTAFLFIILMHLKTLGFNVFHA